MSEQTKINLYVTKKLLGDIYPIGESNVDEKRLENLEETIQLVDRLIYDIFQVSLNRNSQYHSVKISGERAHEYLKSLKYQLEEDEIE